MSIVKSRDCKIFPGPAGAAVSSLEREPPHHLQAEEQLLSAVMFGGPAIEHARAAGLDPADFYRDTHARIYRAALAIHAAGRIVEPVAVEAQLTERGELDETGRTHLLELARLAPIQGAAANHARIIVRTARLRKVASEALRVYQAATAGAQVEDVQQALAELARELDTGAALDATRYRFTTAAEFVESFEESPRALLGENGETILPAGGLVILGGEAGSGKTTLTLDALAHLAGGRPWLTYPVAEPLRVLVIENEGPRAEFRAKLKAKANACEWPFLPNVIVLEEPWARFSFANPADRQALREYIRSNRVDLVIADPLDSLGITGAGTPEDTRTFVQYLRECGLHDPVNPCAYWILHHFGKDERGSVIGRLRGAWGDHADTVLGLELADGHASRLTYGKLRHATMPAKPTIILAWDTTSRGYRIVDATAQAEQRRADALAELQPAATAWVRDNPGKSTRAASAGIALATKRDRTLAEYVLKNTPALIDVTGRNGGRAWYLRDTAPTVLDTTPVQSAGRSSTVSEGTGEDRTGPPPYHPVKDGGGAVQFDHLPAADPSTDAGKSEEDHPPQAETPSAPAPPADSPARDVDPDDFGELEP